MTNPFDTTSGDSRWKAQPATGGSIRCVVENIPFLRNAGFDVHLGPVGDIDRVTIDTETVETQAGDSALYGIALYLDVGGDGDFFEWKDGRGNTDLWDSEADNGGFGDDGEGITWTSADGKFTVDESTRFPIVAHLGPGSPATWEELVDSVDPDTHAALYIGVLGSGAEDGREEIIVHNMDVMRD